MHSFKNRIKTDMFSALFLTVLYTSVFAADTGKPGINNDSLDHDPPAEKKHSPVILDRMVVTATRSEKKLSETPASVNVVSGKDIEISPAKNVDDLIMKETGIQVKRVVGIGEGIPSDIIIRGIPGALNGSRTLVLVDGIPTNASGTPFMILNEIPLNSIERIEVVRGPYSALYGANAFGGVVSIITKKGDGKPGASADFETSYPFSVIGLYGDFTIKDALKEAGGMSLWSVSSSTSGGNEKLDFLASASYRDIGNYLLRDSTLVLRGDGTKYYKPAENYDYRDIRFFGKCGYRPVNDVDVGLNVRYFNSDLGFGKTKMLAKERNVVTLGEKFLVSPEVNFKLNGVDVHTGFYYRRVNGSFLNETKNSRDSAVASIWKSFSNDWQIEAKVQFDAGERNSFVAGVDFLDNNINFGATKDANTGEIMPSSSEESGDIQNTGCYLQDEITLFDKLRLFPGIRMDYHSGFGTALSPKFGVSYKVNKGLRIHSSTGRAFRAPTMSELYMPLILIKENFALKSNPGLKPEYLWASDLGVVIHPLSNIKFEITGFYNNMKQLIIPDIDIEESAVTYQNSSSAWSAGVEFDLEWKALDWLSFSGGYVYQNSRDEEMTGLKEKITESENIPLDYIPNHSLDFGIDVEKKINDMIMLFSMGESFIGKRQYLKWDSDIGSVDILIDGNDIKYLPPLFKLKSYWRTDLSFKIRFKHLFWTGISVQNLFNSEYEESGGTLAPGRFATLKIGFEI